MGVVLAVRCVEVHSSLLLGVFVGHVVLDGQTERREKIGPGIEGERGRDWPLPEKGKEVGVGGGGNGRVSYLTQSLVLHGVAGDAEGHHEVHGEGEVEPLAVPI